MRDREEQNLRQLHRYNRIAAAAVSHEVRNLCGAIAAVRAVEEKHSLAGDEDFQGLVSLVKGLEQSRPDLHSRVQDAVEPVPVRSVLDNLRIVIEPDWRESGASHRMVPARTSSARGGRSARVAASVSRIWRKIAFARFSRRQLRELTISAAVEDARTVAFAFRIRARGRLARSGCFSRFSRRGRNRSGSVYFPRDGAKLRRRSAL